MALINNIRLKIYNSSTYQSVKKGMRSAEQKLYNCVPDYEFKNNKVVKGIVKAGQELTSAEQRLITGVTALMSQPFIDANNKDVDKNTRKISVCRTLAKIIAGTLTGYAIRKGCIKAIANSSFLQSSVNKLGEKVKLTQWNTIFSPKNAVSDKSDAYLQYRNAMGTILALVVMTFTNFIIDAPLTKFLTNQFAKIGGNKNEKSS